MKNKCQHEWKYNSATVQNDVIDVVRTSYKPACHIRKISKYEYIRGYTNNNGDFISDGIVYEVAEKNENMRNRRSLRQIFRTLRQLITTNFSGGKSELFVTLTYAEQHNNPDKIYRDLDLFWKRLKYNHPALKYIAIVEPHATGNFHVHMLLSDTDGNELYIPNADMEKMWGMGFTKTERLEDVDNIGAYFIAYFTNLELSPDEIKMYEQDNDIEVKNGKAYIKGKRLDYYPEHMRIYRHSKNCDKPIKITGLEVSDVIEGAKCTYSHDTTFESEGNEYTIRTEQYRKD